MKFTLTIDAESAEELREACRQFGGESYFTGERSRGGAIPKETVAAATALVDKHVTFTGQPVESSRELPEPTLAKTSETDVTNSDADRSQPITEAPSDTPAPIAAVFTESVTPAPPETDASGLPHDERIHAGSKALNADGTWRKRRGVDDETVASVEAELRFNSDGPPAEDDDTTVQNPVDPDQAEPGIQEPVVTPQAAPEQVSTPVTEPDIAATPAATMKVLTGLMTSGVKTPAYLKELSTHAGINVITEMLKNEDAHRLVREKLQADGVL